MNDQSITCRTFNNCNKKPNIYIKDDNRGNKTEILACRHCRDRLLEYLPGNYTLYLKENKKKSLLTGINYCLISTEKNFDKFKDEIKEKFRNLNLEDYEISEHVLNKCIESKGRKLLVTRPKCFEHIRKELYIRLELNKMVKQKGYHIEDIVDNDTINFETIEQFIKELVKIFVGKQIMLIKSVEIIKRKNIIHDK
jgi:hypothetical protein